MLEKSAGTTTTAIEPEPGHPKMSGRVWHTRLTDERRWAVQTSEMHEQPA